MERQKFQNEFHKASDQLDKRKLKKIARKSIDSSLQLDPKGDYNLIIVSEELAELTQQVMKAKRGKLNKISMLEEMADVVICLSYLQEICDISTLELNKAINVKLDRLDKGVREWWCYQ